MANSICLIDADYRGEILLRFKYIWQPNDFIYVPSTDGNSVTVGSQIAGKPNLDKIYKKGDKICQLKVTKVEGVKFTLVDVLDSTTRTGGFGSTDGRIKIPSVISELYLKENPNIVPKKYVDLLKEKEIK